jgi:hypothetical protein
MILKLYQKTESINFKEYIELYHSIKKNYDRKKKNKDTKNKKKINMLFEEY